MHRFATRTVLVAGIVVGAQLATALLARSDARLWLTALPWVLSLGAATVLVSGRLPRPSVPRANFRSPELWLVIGLTVLAGLLRLPRLETLPAGIYGDEGEFGAIALAISQGEGPPPFGVAFLGDPALYVHVLAPFVAWMGPTMEAIRLPSALVGVATVPLFYGLARNLFGRFAATLAALLLATSAVHIHFSRLALNVIWVPFFTCLSLWLLKRGLDERRESWFLLAGIAGGIGFYFHFGARLIVPMMVLILVTESVIKRDAWRQWLRATGFVLGGALLALSPLLANLSNTPELLNAHTNRRGIWNHWQTLADRYETVPANKAGILWEQIERTFLAFVAEPDSRYGAVTYRFMDQPLLPAVIAALAIVGILVLCLRWRSEAARITLVWIVVPCAFASILTDVAGQAHRLLNPTLAMLLAAAVTFDAIRPYLRKRLGARATAVALACLMVAPLIAGFADGYRYLRPGATDEFGVPGTAQARCLAALPSGTLALINGAPRIYARHGPSRYLADDVTRRDMDGSTLPAAAGRQPTVILVHEWNRAAAARILAAYPWAISVEVERPSGSRVLTVIAINPDRETAERVLADCRDNAEI